MAKLAMADFSRSEFFGGMWDQCEAPMVQMGGCVLDGCEFVDCNLEQAVFVGSILKDVRFVRCRLAYSSFAGATIRSAEFVKSNLHGADLDFIENNHAVFDDCDLWGARASLGCQFWNGTFDERTCDRFVAMVARIHPDPDKRARLEGVAGNQLRVVKRLMDRREPEDGNWPGGGADEGKAEAQAEPPE